jgi:hypothetical protein
MDQRDLEAMRRAVATLQADPELRDTIETLLQTRGEAAAGEWAAGYLQLRNLRLKPHECPPADSTNVKEPRDVYGCRPNEVALLRKLLSLGISRYEANPMAAIERAERARGLSGSMRPR